jgi:hypothetical protein
VLVLSRGAIYCIVADSCPLSTYFPAAIALTLQLPKDMEKWSNEKLLRFVCFMWTECRHVRSQWKALIETSDTAKSGVDEKDEEEQNWTGRCAHCRLDSKQQTWLWLVLEMIWTHGSPRNRTA